MQWGEKKERGQQHPKRRIIFIYIDIYKGDMTAFLRPLSSIVIVTYRRGSPIIMPLKNFSMTKQSGRKDVRTLVECAVLLVIARQIKGLLIVLQSREMATEGPIGKDQRIVSTELVQVEIASSIHLLCSFLREPKRKKKRVYMFPWFATIPENSSLFLF